MKKFYFIPFLSFFIACLLPGNVSCQSFIEFSKLEGSTDYDYAGSIKVVNGETYAFGYKYNVGTTILTKYAVDGSEIYSTDIVTGSGPGSSAYFNSLKVINGEVYLLGRSFNKLAVVKVHVDGTIDFVKLIGGTSEIMAFNSEIQIVGNEMFITGMVQGNDFPVTMGNIPPAYNFYNGFLVKISTTDGAVLRSMFIPAFTSLQIEAGALYMAATVYDSNLPVTIGGAPGNAQNIYIQKIRTSDFSIVYARYMGNAPGSSVSGYKVLNGELHLTGSTTSPDFPVTNNSSHSPVISEGDGIYTRLNADGSIGFSTYLAIAGYSDYPRDLKLSNANIFIIGFNTNINDNTDRGAFLYKLRSNGSVDYLKRFNIISDVYFDVTQSFEVINDEVYLAGAGIGADFPVINGSQYNGERTGYFMHYDPAGNITFSTFLPTVGNYFLPIQVVNNKIYLVFDTEDGSFPSTDHSTISGESDNFIIVLKPDGTPVFSRYLGGSDYDYPNGMAIDNGNIHVIGNTQSGNFPVTDNVLAHGLDDWYVTKISSCATGYNTEHDTLSPRTQTVCRYGLTEVLIGQDIVVPADSLPTLYLNGLATLQQPITGTKYQWQISNAFTGPWADIAGATLKDYRPVIGAINQYYRRLSFTPFACGTAIIHTSDTATVLVNALTAPTVNGGGPFTTCPASAITIGGSPTASGGTAPFTSYNWDFGAAAVANPTVSPLNNTIYTVTVTDAAGCKQISQAVVLVYRADAGPDKSNCAGVAVRIGSNPIAGLPGVVYDWLPATDLTSSSIAQPFSNPPVQTNYALTLTIPKSGGGTCITHDTVTVTPVAAPVTNNFAGPDIVMCLGDSVSLGTTPEAGFYYSWNPANNLVNINNATATYYIDNNSIPIPDPATINLVAYKNGCTFTDQVIITTIESNAGNDGCGPKIIGQQDRTPNINEIYSWVKVSGPGNFTGATNLPQVPVSASVGGTTIYGLTVSYNGGSCYSEVAIPDTCFSIDGNASIRINALYGCPGYNANNGVVELIASSSIADAMFTWQPNAGLSAYTGNSVSLTDNIPRTYTVTATSIADTSVHNTATITTNNPAYVAPVFPVTDTAICLGNQVMIGLPPTTGYSYSWTGTGLSNNFISNPVATTSSLTYYYVTVTNGTGCILKDTVKVFVQIPEAQAGPDLIICSNGIATLGSFSYPNINYEWQPQSAPWQNGTNQFSAQPQVLVATSVTYTLTVTSSAGCIATDMVNITVNNSPTVPNAPNKISCLGSGTWIGSPALPGVSYQWTPSIGLNDASLAQPYASPVINTTYTLVATFPGACVLPATDQVIVTVNDPSFSMPDINFCPANGPVALGVAAPPGMNSYFWRPQALVTYPYIPNPSTLNPPPNATTTFTLRIENQFGCYYTDTIQVIPFTQAPVAGANQTACKNQPKLIGSASNATGPSISYSWNPVIYLDNASSPNPAFTGTATGTFQYVLTKTDNNIPCTIKDTIVINVVDLLPNISSPTICRNSCVQIGPSPISGINYQWTPVNGLSDPEIANPIACIDTATANYIITASDQTGCTVSANIVVGVNAVPGLQVFIPDIIACAGDNNVMFNPSVPAGSYSYLWSPDNGTLSNINIPNPAILVSNPGTTQYSLQITDNTTGCTNIAFANVEVNNCSPYARVGNYMWFDSNPNGIQDDGELGVSGTTVKLYNSIGYNVATTVTNAIGSYYFSDIPPGNDYYIVFEKPAGYIFTTQYTGGITGINNSKADATGRTANFNLITGDDISNMDAGIRSGGIVPVTLLSFTASLQNRKTLLNWQTTAEFNNHYFEVERSNTGNNFVAIGRVNGNGTTSLPHNYSLIDHAPLIGMNYYRLKQVDFDGQATYSQIVPVELNADAIINAYYNNLDNSIHIILKEKQENVQLKLYSYNGQLVKSAALANNTNNYAVELPALSTGVYMLQIANGEFNYSKKLFIKK